MKSSEIVVSTGPRNKFLETFLIEMLTEAKIPARFALGTKKTPASLVG